MAGFSANPERLFSVLSKNGATTSLLFTSTAEGGTIVNSVVLFNKSAASETVEIYQKPSEDLNATVQTDEQLYELTLTPKQTMTIKGPIVLNEDDQLAFKTAVDDSVVVYGYGSNLIAP